MEAGARRKDMEYNGQYICTRVQMQVHVPNWATLSESGYADW
jgi:hypothetical protein